MCVHGGMCAYLLRLSLLMCLCVSVYMRIYIYIWLAVGKKAAGELICRRSPVIQLARGAAVPPAGPQKADALGKALDISLAFHRRDPRGSERAPD